MRYSRDSNLLTTLQHFFIEGLRPDVKFFVLSHRPRNFDDAVDVSEYFEELDLPATSAPLVGRYGRGAAAAEGSSRPRRSPLGDASNRPDSGSSHAVDELAKKLERLTLKLASLERSSGGRARKPSAKAAALQAAHAQVASFRALQEAGRGPGPGQGAREHNLRSPQAPAERQQPPPAPTSSQGR